MQRNFSIIGALSLLIFSSTAEIAVGAVEPPRVIASIKPLHSLASLVMGDLGKPELLLSGDGSPHQYALKPSQAAALEQAEVILWIGPMLEAFLKKPIQSIGAKAKQVALFDGTNLQKLPLREGGLFDDHDHGHGHEETAWDPHVWLDPENAKVLAANIALALGDADPANAAAYRGNAEAVAIKLDALIDEVETLLQPVRDGKYVVFHDAYQYFEFRFDMSPVGSITVNPEITPGAERVGEIRDALVASQASCVFAEPQFTPKMINTVIEGTSARAGLIDPIGAVLDDGPDLYVELIRAMALSMRECLE